jgi:hypothetical protein
MAEPAVKQGVYLYAVIPGPEAGSLGLTGLNGGEVYSIGNGGVAAVVSAVPNAKLRPERRHLAAQQNVLKGLLRTVPALLPMSFGIIADGPKAIKRILSQNQVAISQQLQRVAGMVEMGLRVIWDVPNSFEYFVNTHEELRAARDRLLRPSRSPSQEDMLAVGRLFDRLLQEDRDAYTEKVAGIMSRSCREIKWNRCRQESEVMNLACLLPRTAQAEFEQDVFEAAKLFDNNFAFDYNGPWAPHNFVDLELKL